MRTGSAAPQWLIGDHLGSTSKVANGVYPERSLRRDGTLFTSQLYKPWGELRYPTTSALPTKFQYTGQYSYAADFGLLYYNARWLDPQLGRFAQADTVIPAGVQGLDRYSGMNNNPVKFTDPTGHSACDGENADTDCDDDGPPHHNDPDITAEFNKIVHVKGQLAAIEWLAGVFGIRLPEGVTWAFVNDRTGKVRGYSPPSDDDTWELGNALDDRAYITSTAFKEGDWTVVLSVMVHEARHAYVESKIEERWGGEVPEPEDPRIKQPAGAVGAALELDADKAVFDSGIPLSPLAARLRREHESQYTGQFTGSSCGASTIVTACIDTFYQTSLHAER